MSAHKPRPLRKKFHEALYVPPVSTFGVHRLVLPLKTICEANARGNTRGAAIAKTKRIAAQREMVGLSLRAWRIPRDARRVEMTRLSPGTLDPGGNLESALKAIRDEIAKHLGVSDGVDTPVEWICKQERSRLYGAVIELSGVRQ